MPLYLKSSKIIGTPSDSGWTLVHEFASSEEDKLKSRGRFFAIVSASKPLSGVNSIVTEREILARLHEEYFGNTSKSVFNALRDSVAKVVGEFVEPFGQLEVAAAVFTDNVIYITCCGGAHAEIFRNGMLAKILASSDDKVVSASGYPKDKDLLILGTSGFFETFSQGVLIASFEKAEPSASLEFLAPRIYSSDISGRIGVIVVKFSDREGSVPENGKPAITQGFSGLKESQNFLARMMAKPTNLFKSLSRFIPEKKVYLKTREAEVATVKGKKLTLLVGFFFLLVLVLSIIFGVRQKNIRDKKMVYEKRLSEALHNFDESRSIFTIDKGRSRELFIKSQSLAQELASEGVKDEDLTKLVNQINESEAEILGIFREEPKLFIDLGLLSDGFSGSKIILDSEDAYVLGNDSKLVKVDLGSKRAEFLAKSSLKKVLDTAVCTGHLYILGEDALYELSADLTKKIEKDWSDKVLIYCYAGNLYVLDINGSSLYKYLATSNSFSNKQNWLTDTEGIDFFNINSWAIDGFVWILTKNQELLKLGSGRRMAFDLTGSPGESDSYKSIYLNEDDESIYVLTQDSKKIIVFDKSGVYKSQYLLQGVDVGSFVVSKDAGKIILLSGGKLFSIDLK